MVAVGFGGTSIVGANGKRRWRMSPLGMEMGATGFEASQYLCRNIHDRLGLRAQDIVKLGLASRNDVSSCSISISSLSATLCHFWVTPCETINCKPIRIWMTDFPRKSSVRLDSQFRPSTINGPIAGGSVVGDSIVLSPSPSHLTITHIFFESLFPVAQSALGLGGGRNRSLWSSMDEPPFNGG